MRFADPVTLKFSYYDRWFRLEPENETQFQDTGFIAYDNYFFKKNKGYDTNISKFVCHFSNAYNQTKPDFTWTMGIEQENNTRLCIEVKDNTSNISYSVIYNKFKIVG